MQNVQKDQDYVGELSLRLEEIVWGLDKSTRNLHFVLFFSKCIVLDYVVFPM